MKAEATPRPDSRSRGASPIPPDKNGHVAAFKPPSGLKLTIQTVYGKGVKASGGPRKYGRGATPQDVKDKNTSLGFHEGQHGVDYVEYLQTHPLPQFGGKVGMTPEEFEEAEMQYRADVEMYEAAMGDFSEKRTDCVAPKMDGCP